MRLALLALSSALVLGCGADPYGHGRAYSALDAEAAAEQGAEPYDPVMAKREPDAWHQKKVTLFGVVKKRDEGASKQGYLALSVRNRADRNLCQTKAEDSCRTTVSSQEFDVVHARVRFTDPADELGPESIGVGSLVRIVGTLAKEADADGGLVLEASYYRHWPHGFYVTDAAASSMRR